MKNIVILLSGRGSNFVSIVKEAERAGWAKEGLKIACVVSNRPGAAGLERAKEFGIDAFCVDHKTYETREAFENAVIDILDRYKPAVVVLAGFMRVLTPNFVNHFGGRILNIHPALLPLFKGLDTHQRALDGFTAVLCTLCPRSLTGAASSGRPRCRCLQATLLKLWLRASYALSTFFTPAPFMRWQAAASESKTAGP